MNLIRWHYQESCSQLDIKLAVYVKDCLSQALQSRAQVGLVVSGGRTPLGFFHELSQQSLDWDRVVITLSDERWVTTEQPESNEKWVRAYLLKNRAAAATFISLKSEASSPHAGQVEIEARLKALPCPIEVVILGMGEDGHTKVLPIVKTKKT